ncbi:hypothetical protein Q3G72_008164 [Acer saccharum]|nr:hypothetical protein Q3G72_008164 [Acer saccharum]
MIVFGKTNFILCNWQLQILTWKIATAFDSKVLNPPQSEVSTFFPFRTLHLTSTSAALHASTSSRFFFMTFIQSGSIASQNGESTNAAVIVREVTTIGRTETLPPGREMNHPQSDRMAIDGPVSGLGPSTSTQSHILSESGRGSGSENMGSKQMEVCPGREVVAPKLVTQMQDPAVDHQL